MLQNRKDFRNRRRRNAHHWEKFEPTWRGRIIRPTGRDSPPLVLGREDQGVVDVVGYASIFFIAALPRPAPLHNRGRAVLKTRWR